MVELIGQNGVDHDYPDPRRVNIANVEYFRLWDEYERADSLARRLTYIYIVDAWAGFAYATYLESIDPVTKWHLQTILGDECFHVSFGQRMAERYVTAERDKENLAREEEKIAKILVNVTDGFLSSGV